MKIAGRLHDSQNRDEMRFVKTNRFRLLKQRGNMKMKELEYMNSSQIRQQPPSPFQLSHIA